MFVQAIALFPCMMKFLIFVLNPNLIKNEQTARTCFMIWIKMYLCYQLFLNLTLICIMWIKQYYLWVGVFRVFFILNLLLKSGLLWITLVYFNIVKHKNIRRCLILQNILNYFPVNEINFNNLFEGSVRFIFLKIWYMHNK